jgi:hypothetical protein
VGVIHCPKHGYRGWHNCCPHVATAFDADADCPGAEWREYGTVDGSGPVIGVWLCPQCAAAGRWPRTGTAIDGDEFPERVPVGELRGICVDCFAGWQRAHGIPAAEPVSRPQCQ